MLIVSATSRHCSVLKRQVAPDVSQLLRWVAVDMILIHHSSDHANGRNLATAHISTLCIPVIKSNYFLFTTFIHAKLGISPPTRCLRCATDGSAQSIDCAVDGLRCANDGAGSSHWDVKSPFMTLDRLAKGE